MLVDLFIVCINQLFVMASACMEDNSDLCFNDTQIAYLDLGLTALMGLISVATFAGMYFSNTKSAILLSVLGTLFLPFKTQLMVSVLDIVWRINMMFLYSWLARTTPTAARCILGLTFLRVLVNLYNVLIFDW